MAWDSPARKPDSFPCNNCGACCREAVRIRVAPTQDGCHCLHQELKLDGASRCGIFKARPQICRIDGTKPPNVSLEDWYKMTAEACNRLQEKEGLGPEWRIRIS